jgi:hypothetical protein
MRHYGQGATRSRGERVKNLRSRRVLGPLKTRRDSLPSRTAHVMPPSRINALVPYSSSITVAKWWLLGKLVLSDGPVSSMAKWLLLQRPPLAKSGNCSEHSSTPSIPIPIPALSSSDHYIPRVSHPILPASISLSIVYLPCYVSIIYPSPRTTPFLYILKTPRCDILSSFSNLSIHVPRAPGHTRIDGGNASCTY